MGYKNSKITILDYLIPLHVSYLYKAFDLKKVGSSSRRINLHAYNPLTGKNETVAQILVSITIESGKGNDHADLFFSINGKELKQRIDLIAKKSSLNKGNIFYLKCPITGKQRRKLFLYNSRFVSKLSIPSSYYLSEIQSKKERRTSKDMKSMIRLQNTAIQGKKKHFKRYYDGNLTKRYMKILEANESLKASW